MLIDVGDILGNTHKYKRNWCIHASVDTKIAIIKYIIIKIIQLIKIGKFDIKGKGGKHQIPKYHNLKLSVAH